MINDLDGDASVLTVLFCFVIRFHLPWYCYVWLQIAELFPWVKVKKFMLEN